MKSIFGAESYAGQYMVMRCMSHMRLTMERRPTPARSTNRSAPHACVSTWEKDVMNIMRMF